MVCGKLENSGGGSNVLPLKYKSLTHFLLESHKAVYTDLSFVALARWFCASSNTCF